MLGLKIQICIRNVLYPNLCHDTVHPGFFVVLPSTCCNFWEIFFNATLTLLFKSFPIPKKITLTFGAIVSVKQHTKSSKFNCIVLLLIVLFYVLFVCKCLLYYCYRVSTKLQLTNISYHIIS